MEELATTLMRIFAMGLGMDEHYFDDKVDRHITNFSVLHYPLQHEAPRPASCAPARTPTTAP
jgi:isopenicillin N synthase-like dioxygenase